MNFTAEHNPPRRQNEVAPTARFPSPFPGRRQARAAFPDRFRSSRTTARKALPMTPQTQSLIAMISALRARAAAAFADENRSKGASAIEWVIITAVAAALAIAVGVIITKLVTDKANSISVG